MKLTTLAVSLISAGLATIITAKVVEKQMYAEFDERMERELADSIRFLEVTGEAEATEEYQDRHHQVFGTKFDLTKPSLEEVVNKHQKVRYDQVVKSEGYSPEEEPAPEEGVEGALITTEQLPDIHAISTEEFLENESGFLQSTLNYCSDGGVLDEQGDLVVDHEVMIGSGRPPFGSLSGEPHIVYLRNTRINREFEVVEEDISAAEILATPGSGYGDMP